MLKNQIAIICTLLGMAVAPLSGLAGTGPFTEDFTTLANKDALNTTADWNTTDGELKLFPFTPVAVGNVGTGNFAYEVAVAGDLAFIADGSSGLQVVDVSNPASPAIIGSCDTPGYALKVHVSGDVAFVADNSSGILAVDVRDPANPVLMQSVNTLDSARDIFVVGDHAFIANGNSGLMIADISDPAVPFAVGIHSIPGHSYGLFVHGDNAYVGVTGQGAGAGLEVFRVMQDEVAPDTGIGQSLVFDETEGFVQKVRLSASQTVGVAWEVSTVAGDTWQDINPGGNWTTMNVAGSDLVWRSNHIWEPGVNPTVFNLEIDWLFDHPLITSVSDVPNDQGRQVRVTWKRSSHDFVGESIQAVEYAVYRRIDTGLKWSQKSAARPNLEGLGWAARENIQLMKSAGWDFVTTVPVLVEDEYSVVVPTLADSTVSEGLSNSVFKVNVLTSLPGIFHSSPPDSGYSVDNLAPIAPAGFLLAGLSLGWDESPEADFNYFTVYGSTSPVYDGIAVAVGHTTGTDFDITGQSHLYYHLTATDFSGNESQAASTNFVSGVPGVSAASFALNPNVPNPYNPKTTITFDLPTPEQVYLRVFGVNGHLLKTLIAGEGLEAQTHSRVWDGTDETGRRVAAGVYFFRLDAGNFSQTNRMLLVI